MLKPVYILLLIVLPGLIFTSCERNEIQEPRACMAYSDNLPAGEQVNFSAVCSQRADSFLWVFENGQQLTGEEIFYAFEEEGTYLVQLLVYNEFGTDSVLQIVQAGEPTVITHEGSINSHQVWHAGNHLITGDIFIDGCTVEVKPGARVRFAANTGIYVGKNASLSGLIVRGTGEKPVILTSSLSDPSAGDWNSIAFLEGADSTNLLQNCVIEYGGGADATPAMVWIEGNTVSIENTEIRESYSYGLQLDSSALFSAFENNTLNSPNRQLIKLSAAAVGTIGYGNDFGNYGNIEIMGGVINQREVIWKGLNRPYFIQSDIVFMPDADMNLSIDAGADFIMKNGAHLYIGNPQSGNITFKCLGESNNPVTFTSFQPNDLKQAGDWGGFDFHNLTPESKITYSNFSYAGSNQKFQSFINLHNSTLGIQNCIFEEIKSTVVSVGEGSGLSSFNMNSMVKCPGFAIELHANQVTTIQNLNKFDNSRGICVRGGIIDKPSSGWINHGIPYVIKGDIKIGSTAGSTVQVYPGTNILFTAGSSIQVGHDNLTGELIALGTQEELIIFCAEGAEEYLVPGLWEAIFFTSSTGSASKLKYCVFNYGGGYALNSGEVHCIDTPENVPEITQCTFTNSASCGIYLTGTSVPLLNGNIYHLNKGNDVCN